MRVIPLSTTRMLMPGQPEPVDVTYADVLLRILGGPAPRGVTIAQQRIDCSVMTAIEVAQQRKANKVMLEEQQWARLSERIESHEFGFASPAFVEIADQVKHAKQCDPNASKPARRGG